MFEVLNVCKYINLITILQWEIVPFGLKDIFLIIRAYFIFLVHILRVYRFHMENHVSTYQ